MQRYVARENIKRFKEQLANCFDEQERETLKQLLAAEEEKLEQLKRTYSKSPEHSDPALQFRSASAQNLNRPET